jgi:hypothetical protein
MESNAVPAPGEACRVSSSVRAEKIQPIKKAIAHINSLILHLVISFLWFFYQSRNFSPRNFKFTESLVHGPEIAVFLKNCSKPAVFKQPYYIFGFLFLLRCFF